MATKQPPPLMKKHSQTDLVSRLKTRKILGVGGEDDDGEVHRSKVRITPMHCNNITLFWVYGVRKLDGPKQRDSRGGVLGCPTAGKSGIERASYNGSDIGCP